MRDVATCQIAQDVYWDASDLRLTVNDTWLRQRDGRWHCRDLFRQYDMVVFREKCNIAGGKSRSLYRAAATASQWQLCMKRPDPSSNSLATESGLNRNPNLHPQLEEDNAIAAFLGIDHIDELVLKAQGYEPLGTPDPPPLQGT